MEQTKTNDTKEKVDKFIFDWHDFPFDYWWRKKYKIPFGSQAHREMNFIDMYIEYREEFLLNKALSDYEKANSQKDDRALGIKNSEDVVKLSKKEIDEDFENLDLSQFDKK